MLVFQHGQIRVEALESIESSLVGDGELPARKRWSAKYISLRIYM